MNTLRIATRLLLSFFVIVAVTACGGAHERKAEHLEKARAFFDQGRFEKARVEYKNAIYIDPKDAGAHFGLAETHEKLGNIRSAVGEYLNVLKLDPDNMAARARLGYLFAAVGARKQALEQVEEMLKRQPGNPDALTIRAMVAARDGNVDEALADVQAALEKQPDHLEANLLLSSLYAYRQQNDKALAVLQKALAAHPDEPRLQLQMARVLLGEQKYAEAIPHIEKVIAAEPDKLTWRSLLAGVYLKMGQKDKAEQVLRQAVTDLADDDNADSARQQLVAFLARERGLPAAERQIQDFIEQAGRKKAAKYRLWLAGLYLQKGDVDRTKKILQGIVNDRYAVSDDPAVVKAKDALAALLLQEDKRVEARQLLDQVLKDNPRDETALMLRGRLNLAERDIEAAINDFRAALKANARSVDARRLLAQAHLLNGERELALQNLKKAIEVDPKNVQARIELARLEMAAKDYEGAEKVLEAALEKSPDDVKVLQTLFQLRMAQGKREEAQKIAERVKRLKPKSATGYMMAGATFALGKELEASNAELEKALQRVPSAVGPLTLIIRNYLTEGKLDEAEQRAREAVKAEPDNYVARNLLGEVLMAKKAYRQAVIEFDKAIHAKPDWWVPYRNKAISLLKLNDLDGAIATYRQGVAKARANQTLAIDLAVLYERQGKLDQARKVYEDILKAHPDNLPAANNLAMLLAKQQRDLQRAKALIAKLDKSGNPAYLDTVGWVQLKLGDAKAAVENLKKAVAGAPKVAVIRYHLAKAYLAAGNKQQAAAELKKVVDSGQRFPEADEARKLLQSLQKG